MPVDIDKAEAELLDALMSWRDGDSATWADNYGEDLIAELREARDRLQRIEKHPDGEAVMDNDGNTKKGSEL